MTSKTARTSGVVLLLIGAAGALWWFSRNEASRDAGTSLPPSTNSQFKSRRAAYAGSESCRQCHESHFTNYVHTSHYHTSSAYEEGLAKGHFSDERSVFNVRPGFRMNMKIEDGKHRQRVDAEGFLPILQELDVVIGAGVYAQSFAGWEGSKLVRWQAHYLTPADAWTLNPGTAPEVTRLLISNRCLECHATYFEPDPASPGFNTNHRSVRHNRETGLLKMHCEKCHGPAQAHVDYFKNPREGVDFKALIVNPAKLDRDRQIDVCGLCHSGVGHLLTPSFSYQPGDDLARFISFDEEVLDTAGLHSNNIHLLKKSRCFQASETMSCTTCHDAHRNQRGALREFSQKCIDCHQPERCPQEQKLGPAIRENCIDCHMPKQPDDRFAYVIDGQTYKFNLRTHWIRKHPEAGTATAATRAQETN